jgi:hypothetical protein
VHQDHENFGLDDEAKQEDEDQIDDGDQRLHERPGLDGLPDRQPK